MLVSYARSGWRLAVGERDAYDALDARERVP